MSPATYLGYPWTNSWQFPILISGLSPCTQPERAYHFWTKRQPFRPTRSPSHTQALRGARVSGLRGHEFQAFWPPYTVGEEPSPPLTGASPRLLFESVFEYFCGNAHAVRAKSRKQKCTQFGAWRHSATGRLAPNSPFSRVIPLLVEPLFEHS